MTRLRASLLVLAVFLLGGVCGAFGAAAYMGRSLGAGSTGERIERMAVRRLARRLDLDSEQRRVLAGIVARTRVRMDEVRRETVPRMHEILDGAYDELKPILDPDQQERLEEVRAESARRLGGRGGARGPWPGPPSRRGPRRERRPGTQPE